VADSIGARLVDLKDKAGNVVGQEVRIDANDSTFEAGMTPEQSIALGTLLIKLGSRARPHTAEPVEVVMPKKRRRVAPITP
jgi:hypothetical protein